MMTDVASLLAYIDPGTGALIFQVLIAGILAGLTFFTNVFQRIGRAFGWILVRIGLKQAPVPKPILDAEESLPPREVP